MQALAAVPEPPADSATEVVFKEFLNALRMAPSLVEVNIAAGIALEALRQITS